MGIAKVKIDGIAEIKTNAFFCVCAYCGRNEAEDGTVEINFRDKKIYYKCTDKSCGKMNEVYFGERRTPPLPKGRLI